MCSDLLYRSLSKSLRKEFSISNLENEQLQTIDRAFEL